MTFDAYARLVTETVRRYLPDVAAARSSMRATWRHGAMEATLEGKFGTWWLHAGGLTFTDTLDADHAHVTANNIVVHFEPRYCRGVDTSPFSVDEMARFR